MCNLPFRIEQRPNAEHMSPSGNVPFLKVGRLIVADFFPIIDFVAKKGIKLSDGLTDTEIADMHAYMCIFEEKLKYAEMYIVWMHQPTLSKVTNVRYGSVYPWPLTWMLPKLKKREIIGKLACFHWTDENIGRILEEIDQCCRSLSSKLAKNEYFCGESCVFVRELKTNK